MGGIIKNNTLDINGAKVSITIVDNKDYICITDVAKIMEGKSKTDDIIRNWN